MRGRGQAAASVPGWLEILGAGGLLRIGVLAALFAWLFWAHLVRLYNMWLTPDWSHGFVIPLFCIYLVHKRRGRLLVGEHRGSLWGLALIVLSIAMYAISIYSRYGYPQSLALIPTLAGLILLLRGWRALRLTLFPLAVLVMAIPPPHYLYRAITQPLQQMVAGITAPVLNVLPGVDEVANTGINISYYMLNGAHSTFTVAGACSGMRSLMAFAFLGVAIAYFVPHRLWQRCIVLLIVMPVAVFCNCLRVIITGGLQMYGHPDLASGSAHALLGFAMFGIGIAIFMAVLWVLDHLFVDEDEGARAAEAGT